MKTIIDCKSGPALPPTALQTAAYYLLDSPVEYEETGHRYRFNGVTVPSVTQILLSEGFIDATWYTEMGRSRGSYVHEARHLDDIGQLDETSIDPEIAPYLEAWRLFKRETGFEVSTSEVPMASGRYLYAGRPDVTGIFKSGSVIKRAAVELHNDGKYKLVPYVNERDITLWLSILSIYNWKKNNLRR